MLTDKRWQQQENIYCILKACDSHGLMLQMQPVVSSSQQESRGKRKCKALNLGQKPCKQILTASPTLLPFRRKLSGHRQEAQWRQMDLFTGCFSIQSTQARSCEVL